jgi:hypothetical protein
MEISVLEALNVTCELGVPDSQTGAASGVVDVARAVTKIFKWATFLIFCFRNLGHCLCLGIAKTISIRYSIQVGHTCPKSLQRHQQSVAQFTAPHSLHRLSALKLTPTQETKPGPPSKIQNFPWSQIASPLLLLVTQVLPS